MTESVGIVGGGPVGLYLALALHREGITTRVYERRTEPRLESRSIGIHPPSLELLAEVGLAERFIERGVKVRHAEAYGERGRLGAVDFGACRPPYPFVLTVPQHVTEGLLRTALEQRAPGVLVNRTITAARDSVLEEHGAIVLCDGKSSLVRASLGITFEGADYPGVYAMADFPDAGSLGRSAAVFLGREGLLESFPLPEGQRRWVTRCADSESPTTEALVARVRTRAKIRLNVAEASHPSTFRAARYQAARLALGRFALAGDAAHVVSPIGGQGMNLGWLGAQSIVRALASSLHSGPHAIANALAADGLARARVAKTAARRAELNMWIGRPTQHPRWRDAIVGELLGAPARTLLARAFTMRGLAYGV